MSKKEMLEVSRKWNNLAWHYIRIGEVTKADSCLAISIRMNNEAALQ